jgi:hypothetical protein
MQFTSPGSLHVNGFLSASTYRPTAYLASALAGLLSCWAAGCGGGASPEGHHITSSNTTLEKTATGTSRPDKASTASRDISGTEQQRPGKASRPTSAGPAGAAGAEAAERLGSASEENPGTGGDKIHDITFDDLKLDMPVGTLFERSMLTPRVRELDGEQVRLRGFIFAGGVFQSSGIKSFPFVMNTQCKFGPQGLAYCVVLVELDEGVTTDFTTKPITVEGKLTVEPFNAQGFTWSVYHMQGHKVY